jgi:hypothetical protein
MTKLIVIFTTLALLTACEQQQQASRDVGAKPKEMIDKVTNDLNSAQELANEKMKDAESNDAPAGESK